MASGDHPEEDSGAADAGAGADNNDENVANNANVGSGGGNGRMVTVSRDDGGVFVLPVRAALLSDLIKNTLPDPDDDENQQISPFELLRVNRETLEKVVEFLKHYDVEKMNEIPTPLGGGSFHEVRRQLRKSTRRRLLHAAPGRPART